MQRPLPPKAYHPTHLRGWFIGSRDGRARTAPVWRPKVDLAKYLQVDVMSSGWLHVGVVNGTAKVVPAVALRLKNLSDRTLGTLQVNAVFQRAGDSEEGWGTAFVTAAGSSGLAPGATTVALFLKAQNGYTSLDPDLLWSPNLPRSLPVDGSMVKVFAKYGSNGWMHLGDYAIDRHQIEP